MSEFPVDQILKVLASGDMESLGLMPWGSNYTFLAQISDPATKDLPEDERADLLAVYKPQRGEAPLWDFPNGTLCLREYGAYLTAEALGWRIVPPTVVRSGEHGFGSVQLYVDNDPNQHYFTFKTDPACVEQLQRICIFDLITNNADRKSGHCLRDTDGHIWAIDQGLCFNADYKLRTVIWDFAKEPICEPMLSELSVLRRELEPDRVYGKAMRKLLDADEVKALQKRIDGLVKIRVFPSPNRYERSTPWPPV
jgi:uncharacterized repeat protein (TIGR03843 family)